MEFRIGAYVFGAGQLLFLVAFAYFVLIAGRNLRDAFGLHAGRAWVAVFLIVLAGAAGSYGIGWIGAGWRAVGFVSYAGPDVRQSLVGGLWGSLVAAAAVGCYLKGRPRKASEAVLVPAFLAAAVARIGCLFSGCCHGSAWAPSIAAGCAPFRYWAVWDLALLLCIAGFAAALHRPGVESLLTLRLPLALMFYAVGRFLLEYVGLALPVALGLTFAQWLLLLQFAVGVGLAAIYQRPRPV